MSACPATTSVSAGPAPLYGMCTMSIFAAILKRSVTRCRHRIVRQLAHQRETNRKIARLTYHERITVCRRLRGKLHAESGAGHLSPNLSSYGLLAAAL